MKTTILPESFLRCLSPADRKATGQSTAEEVLAKAQVKNHGPLQKLIFGLLRLRGIEPLTAPVGKKSRMKIGWPDITFAVRASVFVDSQYIGSNGEFLPCAWELKVGKDDLSVEQQQMHIRLSTPPNCWRISVIRNVDQALAELKELGL